ncbi:MAG: hypothetical protein IT307_01740 [Chloroflexi bacterium]|nr:hypothetical protein [Chloroflexota bacterium]
MSAADRDVAFAEARRVLTQNRRRGRAAWDGRSFDFVCPSPRAYPFQWFWDSCFHAIALSHVDVRLAESELRSLLSAAEPDGFIPHILLWERASHAAALASYSVSLLDHWRTATIQPPVLALALERVMAAGGSESFLRETLPVVWRYYDWLARERDPDGAGLIAILQPDESGMDACPKYDALLGLETLDDPGLKAAMARLIGAYAGRWPCHRDLVALDRFVWTDVLVNAIYLQGLESLERLVALDGSDSVGPNASSAAAIPRQRRQRGLATLMERCWSAERGCFFDYAGADRQPAGTLTISALMPLVLSELEADVAARLVQEHLLNEREFWLPYPVPSVAACEPSFEPDYASGLIWRGPTWVNTNWFLVHGLRQHGYDPLARELAERTFALVARGGLREFYHPFSGQGYGADGFGWSALVLDLV